MFDTKDTQKLLRLHETLHSVNTTLHSTILEGTTFVGEHRTIILTTFKQGEMKCFY